MKKKLILNTIVPVIMGTILYYLFCPEVDFVAMLDFCPWAHKLHMVLPTDLWMLKLFRNFFFDFVWAYSFTFAYHLFSDEESSKLQYAFISLFIIFMEVLQLAPNIPGTFDIWDIVVELFAIAIAAYIRKRIMEGFYDKA